MKFDTPSGKIELYSSEAQRKWGISPLPDCRTYEEDPANDSYPLNFLTPNTASRIHSQFGNLNIIRATVQEPVAGLAPADAKKRKINTGDKIRIYNKQGEIYSSARISNRIPPGIVVLPNGLWLNEGGGGNNLIDGRHTDMGFGSAFHDSMVEVEKAE
jgi:anaerobic selenocysteine-containing dehydrogenase